MTRADVLKAIMDAVVAGKYEEDQFDLFKAEYGYEDWMDDYVSGEELSEAESREIDEVLQQGFKMAFDPQWRTIYGVK